MCVMINSALLRHTVSEDANRKIAKIYLSSRKPNCLFDKDLLKEILFSMYLEFFTQRFRYMSFTFLKEKLIVLSVNSKDNI